MAIETNLNQSPYFDDFDETKNFHRVLYRPGYAVQARELTQSQSILQNQIERFANEVMVDGTIVTGGGLATDTTNYVKLRDKNANGDLTLLTSFFDSGAIANVTITGETSGVTGKLVWATEGSEAAAPDYLTIYCHYTNSGSDNTTKAFADNETLIFRTSTANAFVVAANTIVSGATGKALKANIDEGICYHKGNFIRIPPQSIIVGKYTVTPNAYIGLETVETIIDSNADSTLLDNATGATNYAAPGANRLKLYPTLAVKTFYSNSAIVANTASFFRIAEIQGGSIVQRAKDTLYSDIGKYVSDQIHDIHGNFAVEPFNLRIREHLKKTNSLGRYTAAEGGDYQKLVCEVEKGSGYVGGKKVQLLASRFLEIDKATDFIQRNDTRLNVAMGNYAYVKELVGHWDVQALQEVNLYDTAQEGITGKNFGTQSLAGSVIGTANIRGIQWNSGTGGTADGQYRLYIFDVQMNAGYSFADVRSVGYPFGSPNNVMADIVLESTGTAKLYEPSKNTLVFPLGQAAAKQLQTANTQFVYRAYRPATVGTDGTASILIATSNTAHTGGVETVNDVGSLSNPAERNFIVVSRNATTVQTVPHSGTISSYTSNTSSGDCVVVGSSTTFQDQYQVGDLIKIGSNNPQIIKSIEGQTSLTVANTDLGTSTGLTDAHRHAFPPGYVFDTQSNGTIVTTTDGIQLNLQQGTLESTCAVAIYFDALREQAIQTAKTLKDAGDVSTENRFVHINVGNNAASTTGPWPLGVSDAFKLVAVYKGGNTSVSSSDTDVTTHFELDSGQKDAMYDTAYLKQKSDSTLTLTDSDGLMVKFSYFGRSRAQGIGYLSVNSYPIDDANTANTTAITTQEIPVFRSPTTDLEYDLRDVIDFRPFRANTCEPTITGTAGSCPVNPSAGTTFDIDDDGAYMPTPDKNFQTDAQFYLPRRDRIVITENSAFLAIKGVPDQSPRAPMNVAGAMSLGVLDIPPYPSLSPYVARQYQRSKYAVKLTVDNNRRYTMSDLRTVEQRVKNLEYYSTMNLLETATKTRQISSADSIDRFKNGFFVDDCNSHVNSNVKSPYYRAAVDKNRGFIRPLFSRADVSMEKDISFTSSNVVRKGGLVMLDYGHEIAYEQGYASKLRNPVQELLFNWRGQCVIDPPADNTPDILPGKDIQIDFSGFYDAIEQLAEATGLTGETVYGDWITTFNGLKRIENDDPNNYVYDSNGTAYSYIAQEKYRLGTKTTLESIDETISLGNHIENISVREYMRSRELRITGVRMKPNTRVYAYFDEEKVSDYCTPCDSSFNDNGVEGGALVTNANGYVYLKFRIPADDELRFRVGTKRFVLRDVEDFATERDIMTTSAHGEFSSNPLEITMAGTEVQMQVPQFSTEPVVEEKTLYTVRDGDRAWWDPLAQSFSVNTSGSGDGTYLTKIDLFFGKKDSNLPITLQIREVVNGFPTQTILPYGQKTLDPADINVSSDASTPTTFEFDTPVYLKNHVDYCFVAVPAGNSDQYGLWVAKLGDQDIYRADTLINKQTAAGVLFSSSNDKTWNPIQDEDMKFTIHIARFKQTSGTVYIENSNTDFFTVADRDGAFRIGESVNGQVKLTIANTDSIAVGSILQSKSAFDGDAVTSTNYANGVVRAVTDNGNNTVTVTVDAFGTFPTDATDNEHRVYFSGNSSYVGTTQSIEANTATGIADFYDAGNNKLFIKSSAGGFKTGGWVRGQKSGATAQISTIDDLALNNLVPKVPEIVRAKTSTSWAVRSTSSSGIISTTWKTVELGDDNHFYDAEKKLYSKSNEDSLTAVSGSKKSLVLRGTLSTSDTLNSPVIDLTRANAIIVNNVVNNDAGNEDGNVGNAYTRYISKTITLSDGMDAEDMIVYMNAFKPQGTDIKVYARLLNGEDGEAFDTKSYTPLRQVTSSNTYSLGFDGSDVREFEFGFTANTAGQTNTYYQTNSNTHAYLNTGNNEVVTYWGNDGSVYHTYKTFAIKIVMTAEGSHLVPMVDDLRVIALQK